MSRTEINVSSFEHEEIKQSLIEFLKSTNEFGDFDYEGSAINTIVDLLTRDTHMISFLANMIANESFISSAQKRGNVVSHAEKLSYVPKSRTASRIRGNIRVKPADLSTAVNQIAMNKEVQFLGNVNGVSYTFTANDAHTATLEDGSYLFSDVMLYQGNRINNRFVYNKNPIVIPNANVDTSTIKVSVIGVVDRVYTKADSLEQMNSNSRIFFLSENQYGQYEISFGKGILGEEPNQDSIVSIEYINTENEHANGLKNLIAATPIAGYSNIQFEAIDPSFGGSDKEDIESIRWVAPKFYEAQDRGVTSGDYIPLLKSRYSFIKSAKTWGGETNIPPKYGTIQISILAEEGSLITNSVKQEMVESVNGKNVGSVTPEIVDPYMVGLKLNVEFDYDNRLTNDSFNELSTKVKQKCQEYNDVYLYDFDSFYNQSKLESMLLDIKGITTVSIDNKVFKEVDVLPIADPIYEINFNNSIKPGSISVKDFVVSVGDENHRIYDQNGEVFYSYQTRNNTVMQSIGTVDYESGLIEFTVNFVDQIKFVLYAETERDNFYVTQNNVVFIDEVTTSMMETKRR